MDEPQPSRTHKDECTTTRRWIFPTQSSLSSNEQKHRSVERRRVTASPELNGRVNDSNYTTASHRTSTMMTNTVMATSTSSTTTIKPDAPVAVMIIPDVILQLPKEIRNILAGGIAGMVAKSVVAPVDRIKILYQISAIPFRLRDVPTVAYNIIQQEGIVALWKGNTATMIRVFPYSGIQFMTFEICKSYFLQQKNHHYTTSADATTSEHHLISSLPLDPVINPASSSGHDTTTIVNNNNNNKTNSNRHDRKYGLSPMESLIAGMIAGTVSVICTYPLDLVRAQLAVLKRHKPTMSHQQHPSVPSSIQLSSTPKLPTQATTSTTTKIPPNHGFVRVFRDNYIRGGIGGLFRGITPTLFGILPYSGIAFTLNEQGKREIQHYMGRDVTTMERLQCGAFSGLIAQTITYPIEVTRRRMQTIGLVNKNDTALATCLGDNKGTNGTMATSSIASSTTMKPSTTTSTTTAAAVILSPPQQHAPQSPPTLYTTVTHLYAEQGVRGFVKGVSMNWMKGPIAFAISFTTFDIVKQLLENPSERR